MDYVRVSLTYAHSAFPRLACAEVVDGVSDARSTMSTVVTGTLRRCNGTSPWSPQPAPSPNTLFPLISHHWGKDKAREAMQQMLAQRSTPRKPANNVSGLRIDREMDGASWITVDNVICDVDSQELPTPTRIEVGETAPTLPRPARITTAESASLTLESWLAEKIADQELTHSLRSIDGTLYQHALTKDHSHGRMNAVNTREIGSTVSTDHVSGSLCNYEPSSKSPLDNRVPNLQQAGRRGSGSKRSWFPTAETVEHDLNNHANNSSAGSKKKELSKWSWASWF